MFRLLAQTYNSSYDAYSNSYGTTYNGTQSTGGSAFLAISVLIILLFVAVIVVVSIIGMWRVFEKAGQSGWKALVPFYNNWVLYEISGKPGYWSLAAFIPFVGPILSLVLAILAMLQLAKNFGKDTVFAIIWLMLIPIGLLILGFGNAQYLGPNVTDTDTSSSGLGQNPTALTSTQSGPLSSATSNSQVPPTSATQSTAQQDLNAQAPTPPTPGGQPPVSPSV